MNTITSDSDTPRNIAPRRRLFASLVASALLLAGLVLIPAVAANADPSGIEFVEGTGQSAAAGTTFATELVVYVPDDEGGGEMNTPILFNISPVGAAHFSNGHAITTSRTGPEGRSNPVAIIAGDTATTFTVTAATSGYQRNYQTTTTLTVTPATLSADGPVSMSLNGGGQTAPSGELFADPLVAVVFDGQGEPSGIVPVEFTIEPTADGDYLASFTDGSHRTVVETDGGVSPGVQVVADAVGNVEVSATVLRTSITPARVSLTVIPPLPGAPTITAVTPTLDSIAVDFTPATGDSLPVTGYRVDATPAGGGAVTSATGPGSPLTVPALTPGTTYDVTVVALSNEWESAPSTAESVTLLSPPGQPTITGWSQGAWGFLTIDFTPGVPGNPAATYYSVRVTNANQPGDAFIYTTTETHFKAEDLSAGSYNVAVTAVSPIATSTAATVGPLVVNGDDAAASPEGPREGSGSTGSVAVQPGVPTATTGGGSTDALAATGGASPAAPAWLGLAMLVIGGILVGARGMLRGRRVHR